MESVEAMTCLLSNLADNNQQQFQEVILLSSSGRNRGNDTVRLTDSFRKLLTFGGGGPNSPVRGTPVTDVSAAK